MEVTHANLQTNFEQVMANYFDDYGNVAPPDTTVVSWVPLYHNMGLFIGLCAPILAGLRTCAAQPAVVLRTARPVGAVAGQQSPVILARAELRPGVSGPRNDGRRYGRA